MADIPADIAKETILKLAIIDKLEYERCREIEANTLGMRVSALDDLVSLERKKIEVSKDDGVLFPQEIPWESEVNLSDLLNKIDEAINRYMVLPSAHEGTATTLWIVQTYFMNVLECAPILHIKSPEPRCGKTTLTRLIFKMSYKSLLASNISPAALFRLIEQYSPTLLIDEADSFLRENEELRGIINSGHDRDAAFTIRCQGEYHAIKKFCTFGAKVISGIGNIADTLEDRSIPIVLRRMLGTEKKEKMSMHNKTLQNDFEIIRRMCLRFAKDNSSKLKSINPDIPCNLNDRAADNWHSLLSLATLAGNVWSTKAASAAMALTGNEQCTITIGVELLNDIQEIFSSDKFRHAQRIYSSDLLEALTQIDDAPWPTFNRGKPMTARQLAHRLKEFSVKSKDLRIQYGPNKKGFERSDFEDAWERYIPLPAPESAATSATPRQSPADAGCAVADIQINTLHDQFKQNTSATVNCLSNIEEQHVASNLPRQNQNVADKYSSEPSNDGDCRAVADKPHYSGVIEDSKSDCRCGYRLPFCNCPNTIQAEASN
ncbi:MAG: hypothetical protein A3E85_04170 [Gammaproteobacteria bacterium RIFCSPHIGHO2_12_FULL_45_12]|nr:MAG: hypothetical protein A3E85_04170 [Gammaproteobacteria bacterium RIFCSPHIGHO2_12_FULL_45_12]